MTEWHDDFVCERFLRFKFNGGSHLDLSDYTLDVREFLHGAAECRRLALEFETDKPKTDSHHHEARRLRRNSVDECSRAVQCITDRFIDTFRICYQNPPEAPEAEARNSRIIVKAREFRNNYQATRDWPYSFPKRLSALEQSGLLQHTQAIENVNKLRKNVIHGYKTPPLKEVENFLSVTELYCNLIGSFFKWVWEELELFSEYGETLKLSYRPKEGAIWYEYEVDQEELQLAKQLVERDSEIKSLRQEIEILGQKPSNMADDSAAGKEARYFENLIRSSVPEPKFWKGKVEFTDIRKYRNWLSVILAWSGRTQ